MSEGLWHLEDAFAGNMCRMQDEAVCALAVIIVHDSNFIRALSQKRSLQGEFYKKPFLAPEFERQQLHLNIVEENKEDKESENK